MMPNLRLLDSLLNDVDVQGEDHAGDQARLRAGQLLHQGVDLLTQLLPLLLLEIEIVALPSHTLLIFRQIEYFRTFGKRRLAILSLSFSPSRSFLCLMLPGWKKEL